MANLNGERSLLTARTAIQPGEKQLLAQANERARSRLDYDNVATSSDPRGRLLRLQRLERKIDPATLATQACISLPQLYQIEIGECTLFYSQGLKHQAARRVAALLGLDWDALPAHDPDAR